MQTLLPAQSAVLHHKLPVDWTISQSINQNPWRPGVVGGTPTDATAVTAAHRRLCSAKRNNDDIDWSVHFLMLAFNDLRKLTVSCWLNRRYKFTLFRHDLIKRSSIIANTMQCNISCHFDRSKPQYYATVSESIELSFVMSKIHGGEMSR